MKVRGGIVTQQLAENIVVHRERKGAFKAVDDLLKVKGVSEPMLGAMRPYLTASEDNGSLSCADGGDRAPVLRAPKGGGGGLGGDDISSLLNVVRLLGKSEEDIMFHVGPLAHQSFRRSRHSARQSTSPTASSSLYPWAQQQRALRAATWNVEQCTADKAANPGVREVLAMTLLENR